MKKEEIIKILQANDSTLLSFPDRGPWGDKKYRGNCSGFIQAFLMWKYRTKKFAELFAGSGTGYDVAKDMGVKYVGADLNPLPVRPGILSIDAFADDVPEEFYDADMCFMHPPYGAEIKIPYAGSMYPDTTGELALKDLGQMPWDKFMKTLNQVVMKYYAALSSGAYMGILMGDVRRNGLHSMMTDIVKPGKLEQIIIKAQHNCVSDNRTYSSRNFVPVVHEYLLVLQKEGSYIVSFQQPQRYEVDIRDSNVATWASVIKSALGKLGGKATLTDIYREVDGHKKAEKNPHWREKVRQTLQLGKIFRPSERGVWELCTA